MVERDTPCPRPPAWDLVRAAWAGRADAFELLVHQYTALLRYVVARRAAALPRFLDPDEVINETWYQVLRNVRGARFDATKDFASWICGICLNCMKQRHFRPQSLTGSDEAADLCAGLRDGAQPPDLAVQRLEVLAALRECLNERTDRERQAYSLLYVQGLTNVDTAKALGCAESYVRQKLVPHLHRALRACLARKGFRGSVGRELP